MCASILVGVAPRANANPALYEPATDPAVGFNLISWWNFDNAGTPPVDEGVSYWQNAV
jgi:hypothetical protein